MIPGMVAVMVWKTMAPKGDGAIRRCGFIGVDIVLLKEVCHCGVGL